MIVVVLCAIGLLTGVASANKISPGAKACRLIVNAESESRTFTQREKLTRQARVLLQQLSTKSARRLAHAEYGDLVDYCDAHYSVVEIGAVVTTTSPTTSTTTTTRPTWIPRRSNFCSSLGPAYPVRRTH